MTMKMQSFRTAALALVAVITNPGDGSADVVTNVIDSEKLGQRAAFQLYAPPIIEGETAPLLYLLHDETCSSRTDCSPSGGSTSSLDALAPLLDRLIEDREVRPMFIVSAPIATADHQHGWDSFYLDHADGTFPYRDFFVEEFMPHVERALPVPTAGRWIGGSGMGGYGALSLVLDHPALFEGVAAWEPSEYTPVDLVEMDQADYDRRFGPSWGAGRFGAARITEAYLDDSLFGRARDVEAQAFGSTKFYIRLASSGPTAAGGELLRRRMDEKALPVTFTDGMDDGPILFAACMMSQNPRYRTEACLQDVPPAEPKKFGSSFNPAEIKSAQDPRRNHK